MWSSMRSPTRCSSSIRPRTAGVTCLASTTRSLTPPTHGRSPPTTATASAPSQPAKPNGNAPGQPCFPAATSPSKAPSSTTAPTPRSPSPAAPADTPAPRAPCCCTPPATQSDQSSTSSSPWPTDQRIPAIGCPGGPLIPFALHLRHCGTALFVRSSPIRSDQPRHRPLRPVNLRWDVPASLGARRQLGESQRNLAVDSQEIYHRAFVAAGLIEQ